jgi:hypothetical protein
LLFFLTTNRVATVFDLSFKMNIKAEPADVYLENAHAGPSTSVHTGSGKRRRVIFDGVEVPTLRYLHRQDIPILDASKVTKEIKEQIKKLKNVCLPCAPDLVLSSWLF